MEISVSEFKSRCTKILRDLSSRHQVVKITNRGTVIAVITPPGRDKKPNPGDFIGSLKGTAGYSGDIVSPLEINWDADK